MRFKGFAQGENAVDVRIPLFGLKLMREYETLNKFFNFNTIFIRFDLMQFDQFWTKLTFLF